MPVTLKEKISLIPSKWYAFYEDHETHECSVSGPFPSLKYIRLEFDSPMRKETRGIWRHGRGYYMKGKTAIIDGFDEWYISTYYDITKDKEIRF